MKVILNLWISFGMLEVRKCKFLGKFESLREVLYLYELYDVLDVL